MSAEHHSHQVVSSLIEAWAAVNREGQTALDVSIKRADPEGIIAVFKYIAQLQLYCHVSQFMEKSCGVLYQSLNYHTAAKTPCLF